MPGGCLVDDVFADSTMVKNHHQIPPFGDLFDFCPTTLCKSNLCSVIHSMGPVWGKSDGNQIMNSGTFFFGGNQTVFRKDT